MEREKRGRNQYQKIKVQSHVTVIELGPTKHQLMLEEMYKSALISDSNTISPIKSNNDKEDTKQGQLQNGEFVHMTKSPVNPFKKTEYEREQIRIHKSKYRRAMKAQHPNWTKRNHKFTLHSIS